MSDSAPQVVAYAELPAFDLLEGAVARPLFGDRASMNFAELAPGLLVPTHCHPHEQMGIVIRGRVTLTVDGVARELGELDAFVVPSDMPHSVRAGDEGALLLDVFAPVREEFRAAVAARAATSPG